MPIYEYRCQSCGQELEKLQRMSEDKLVDCPACGQPALKRLVSAVVFRLKGSGWYETDFKKDNKRNLADSESADKESTDHKADKSSASTSDDKSATKASDKKPESEKPEVKSGKANAA